MGTTIRHLALGTALCAAVATVGCDDNSNNNAPNTGAAGATQNQCPPANGTGGTMAAAGHGGGGGHGGTGGTGGTVATTTGTGGTGTVDAGTGTNPKVLFMKAQKEAQQGKAGSPDKEEKDPNAIGDK